MLESILKTKSILLKIIEHDKINSTSVNSIFTLKHTQSMTILYWGQSIGRIAKRKRST
jgi:hypothetical protein